MTKTFEVDGLAGVYRPGSGYIAILRVIGITRSGSVLLSDDTKYRADGTELGGGGKSIHPVTSEIRAEVRNKKNLTYLLDIDWQELDNDTRAEVVELLKRREKMA